MRKLVFLLCLIGSPVAAHDYWQNGDKVDPKTKAMCCNGSDTKQFDLSLLKPVEGGFLLLDTKEFIPYERVQPSPDENVWVSRWGGQTKCFFYPMSM